MTSHETGSPLSPIRIIREIAEKHNMTEAQILGSSTRRKYVLVRKEIIERMDRLGMSATSIGRAMKRDHTTILHHLKGLVNNGSNQLIHNGDEFNSLADVVSLNNPTATHLKQME